MATVRVTLPPTLLFSLQGSTNRNILLGTSHLQYGLSHWDPLLSNPRVACNCDHALVYPRAATEWPPYGSRCPYPLIFTIETHKQKHSFGYFPSSIWFYHIKTHFFPSPRGACHCDHVLNYPRATTGGYHDARGGYYEYRGGCSVLVTLMDHLGTVWSIIHVWDPPLKQLPSQQQIHWHYLGLRMGHPFKRCFWAASSLSSLQQTSRASYGTHLNKCFQAASTLSSLQQTLRVPCEAPYETPLDKCLG